LRGADRAPPDVPTRQFSMFFRSCAIGNPRRGRQHPITFQRSRRESRMTKRTPGQPVSASR